MSKDLILLLILTCTLGLIGIIVFFIIKRSSKWRKLI